MAFKGASQFVKNLSKPSSCFFFLFSFSPLSYFGEIFFPALPLPIQPSLSPLPSTSTHTLFLLLLLSESQNIFPLLESAPGPPRVTA